MPGPFSPSAVSHRRRQGAVRMPSSAAQCRDGRLTGGSHFFARQCIFRVGDGSIATMTMRSGKASAEERGGVAGQFGGFAAELPKPMLRSVRLLETWPRPRLADSPTAYEQTVLVRAYHPGSCRRCRAPGGSRPSRQAPHRSPSAPYICTTAKGRGSAAVAVIVQPAWSASLPDAEGLACPYPGCAAGEGRH
jgi:hypothetical protein